MIKKIIELIEPGQVKKFISLNLLFILLGFVEIIGVGSIIPFLNSISYSSIEESDNLTKFLYELIDPSSYKDFLIITGSIVLTMLVLSNFLRALVSWFTSYFVWENQAKMSIRLLGYILNRPYEVFSKENSADISKDVLVETQNFVVGLLLPVLTIISQVVICLSILVALFYFDPYVAFLATGSIFLVFGIFYTLVHKPLQRRGAERFESTNLRFKIVDEAFSGIKLIKLLNKEDYFVDLIKKPSYEFASAMAFQTFQKRLPRYVFEVIAFGAVVLVALFNIYRGDNISDIITVIGLFAFAGYRLLPSISQIYAAINNLTFNSAVLERLYEQRTLKKLDKLEKKNKNQLTDLSKLEYSFQNVSYKYGKNEPYVLNKLSLNLVSPKFVSIVGSTGSGKSTFIDLLLGLLSPTEGDIILNKVPLKNISIEELSSLVGYVPQDVYLTDESIMKNIALGVEEKDIDFKRIIEASRMAEIHELIIEKFDKGYETSVGERGVKLSGGQVQRIGIARALYSKASIIILDEGTSNLDQSTEAKIISNISKDTKTKLLIMVAHRLKTTQKCDQIILFNNGSIEDVGSFSELKERSPTFKLMLNS